MKKSQRPTIPASKSPKNTSSAKDQIGNRRIVFAVLAGLLLSLGLVGIVGWKRLVTKSEQMSAPSSLNLAKRALRNREFELAEKLSISAASDPDTAPTAWWIAIQAADARGQQVAVREYCEKLLSCQNPPRPEVCRQAGEVAFKANSIEISQRFYTLAVLRDPSSIEARQRLIYLLGLSGRLWEAVPHLRWLTNAKLYDYNTLVLLSDHHRVADFSKILSTILQANPNDPQALLGMSRYHLANLRTREALADLRKAQALGLDSEELYASLGQALFDTQDLSALVAWRQSIGATPKHPRIWKTLGLIAKQFGLREDAKAFLAESFVQDPDDLETVFQLSELVQGSEKSNLAQSLLERHKLLDELMKHSASMSSSPPAAASILRIANLCRRLDRTMESYCWYSLIMQKVGNPTSADLTIAQREMRQILDQLPMDELPWQSGTLREKVGLERQTVDLARLDGLLQQIAQSRTEQKSGTVSWMDATQSLGLKFQYFCSPNPEVEGKRIYEFAGGGVGILDFDRDGWPDIFLTQGCNWPPPDKTESRGTAHHQTLYRNFSGNSFRDVSKASQVDIVAFAQGIACGDVDNDGFPDVYVGCIGHNILLLNNGDGTFRDATVELGLETKFHWTTSCAIADLTQDGLPDIYDVNYLEGDDIFERICNWEGGRKRICGPGTFAAEQDTFWLSDGERFWDRSSEAGILQPDGKGLGIVVGDLDGSGRNSIFIANDQSPNFFFSPNISSDQGPWFNEEAQLRGLAFDESGAKQGCMGIAVGDFNQDHRIDLFVTNYVTESNTLYQQTQSGQFEDRTRAANLRESSIPMVGFGTQSIDARLDGILDLIVVNGHLDDFTFKAQLFEMPSQYFKNNGTGHFNEIGSNIGGYFSGKYRGRGMARVDWNRDGLDEVVVTNLDSPAVVLKNCSPSVGNFIAMELVGTQSSRDAIGATVRLESSSRKFTQVQTAGDGYQASNQRRLTFGLGPASTAEVVTITWPSGLIETVQNMGQGHWIVIERLGAFPIAIQ